MGLWTRVREFAGTPRRRILDDLTGAYLEALRIARQLRAHAEYVPYPGLAASLLGLADQEDAHASQIAAELRRLGGDADPGRAAAPRGGRNYWERLANDLTDLQVASKRYLELAQHWDVDYPETAALLTRLAHELRPMERVVGEMVARSDPHASD